MKNNQINQLMNLLNHFNENIQNPAGLSAVRMVLISGKNKYPVEIGVKEMDGKTTYHFPLIGQKIVVGTDGFLGVIRQQAALYDGLELFFHERGGGKKITADDRSVRISTIDPASKEYKFKDFTEQPNSSHGVSQTREYYIRVDEASELLKAIGIVDEKNKVRNDKIRKYNQIDRFVELADPIIREFISRNEPIRVLDCACGKSYLSFVLNYYIREKLNHSCEFLGLDWSEGVIESSKELAETLHYTNMRFIQCDLSQYKPSDFKPSICMSLHACDTATDLAIYTGIRSGSASILCVPCCQKELLGSGYSFPALENSILRHGLLKARFSDLMTDALRVLLLEACGYETSLLEYISPLDSPKNIMIKSRFGGKYNNRSLEEYQKLKKEYRIAITLGKLLEEEGLLSQSHKGSKQMKFIVATKNKDKIGEIREIMREFPFEVISMEEAGFDDEIVENGSTFEENALIKARAIHKKTGGYVMADDSGLSVTALDGAPGIYSSRFAGLSATYGEKIQKIWDMLDEKRTSDRSAQFVCAVAVVRPDGSEFVVRGECHGVIHTKIVGKHGFGYDPVFYMPEYGMTTAQMDPSMKHSISHRGIALRKMMEILSRETRS